MFQVVSLCPDVFAVEWVVVELESGLCPFPNDSAMGVVLHRVLLVLATQNAVPSSVGVEPATGAPTPVEGVPDREPHSWGKMLEHIGEVVLAALGQNPGPAVEIPDHQVLSNVFMHVVCGLETEKLVDVFLGVFFPVDVVLFVEREGCLLGEGKPSVFMSNVHLFHVKLVVPDP